MGDLWIWKYSLESKGALNARTGRKFFEGALVRSGSGFACLHPWPELGDPTLKECLDDLGGKRQCRIVRCALQCAKIDGEAREENKSLFEGLRVPVSHATLPFFDESAIADAVGKGFTHVKVKCGRNLPAELAMIRRLSGDWPDLRWRLDFSERGNVGELIRILGDWSSGERAVIDFLEDPVSYHGGDWGELRRRTGLAMANDRNMESDRGDSEILVVKPAVNEMPDDTSRVVVTSYLDHPFGQVFAAYEAGRNGISLVSGLQTHGVFEESSFSEELGKPQPEFRSPQGVGLGFGDLLEQLPWRKSL